MEYSGWKSAAKKCKIHRHEKLRPDAHYFLCSEEQRWLYWRPLRTSERRFWRALYHNGLRLLIFISVGLILSAITTLLIGQKFDKHDSDKIQHAKTSFATFRVLCHKGDFEQARSRLKDYDSISASILQTKWLALENKSAGAPQWIFEEASYNSDPQFIALNYRLANNDKYPRKVTVLYVPSDSTYAIKEIRVDLLSLQLAQSAVH